MEIDKFEKWRLQKESELKETTFKQVDELQKKGEPYVHLLMLLEASIGNLEGMRDWFKEHEHLLENDD
jgi:hypothetical protein